MRSTSPRKILESKASLEAVLVAVFDRERTDRNLRLAPLTTRCIRRGEIHELLVVDRKEAGDRPILHVGYLGFAEFTTGGVVEVDDDLVVADKGSFRILGFDETHAPNHMNIVLTAAGVTTGVRCGMSVGDAILVRPIVRGCPIPSWSGGPPASGSRVGHSQDRGSEGGEEGRDEHARAASPSRRRGRISGAWEAEKQGGKEDGVRCATQVD